MTMIIKAPPGRIKKKHDVVADGQPHLRHRRRVALLQTLLFVSLSLWQQKWSSTNAQAVSVEVQDGALQRGTDNELLDDASTTATDLKTNNEEQIEINLHGELESYRQSADYFYPHGSVPVQNGYAPEKDMLLLVALDGTIAAVAKSTGETIWKTSPPTATEAERTGHKKYSMKNPLDNNNASSEQHHYQIKPLLSTTTTTVQAAHSEWRTSAVPSIDGHVFLTAATAAAATSPRHDNGDNNNNNNNNGRKDDVTVTTTIRDLVNRAPFVDSRGRVYSGQRQSHTLAIDRRTGHVVQVIDGGATHQDQPNNILQQDRDDVIWIGRVDYSVVIQEPSGQTDVQFSVSEILGAQDLILGSPKEQPWQSSGRSQERMQSEEYHHQRLTSGNNSKKSSLVATPNGAVAYRDSETGSILWVADETFDTPVAYAIDAASGMTLGIDIVQDAVMPNGSIDYLSREIERQLRITEQSDTPLNRDEHTIVAALPNGQLYALPLGTTSGPRPLESSSIAGASASTQIKRTKPKLNPITGRHDTYFHHHHHHQDPRTSHGIVGSSRKNCSPGSSSYPTCLVGGMGDGPFAQSQTGSFLSESARPEDDHAIVPFYHPDYGYIPPDHFYVLDDTPSSRRRRYMKILKILGSWLAPTVAFIFVVAFELGRRKRMKDNARNDLVSRDTERLVGNNSQTQDLGVIQVCEDEILGYGGHGTVVYRGVLDGRQVAVKRMLKAYHASADREISLLIESDGHPNVVRYFLKEVRGDFVYLALELCDMSLHDMIGTLRRHRDLSGKENREFLAVTIATRTVLYQIASGVKHLHHLRIVHRDLKPANILLADSSKAKAKKSEIDDAYILRKFEEEKYVAKISDMGLGKQFVGQSSYGASLLADGSLRGQSNGAVPSITGTGPGPGSVGWQAPEVMALRSPTDVSVRSDGSSGLNDSLIDSSPMETNAAVRTSRSVDIFSLGCIFYSTLVPGSHPFGEWYEREANIMHNRPNVEPLLAISCEAHDLVSAMIHRIPSMRPTARQVCDHPFFWTAERRLSFLCDLSDRLETDAIIIAEGVLSKTATKLFAVERNASKVVGISWDRALDDDLVSNVQRFRTYDPSSVRDLLRLIRNKNHHFDELPERVKETMNFTTTGLLAYFEARFPALLTHCFRVCQDVLEDDDPLAAKYCISPTKRGVAVNGRSRPLPISEEVVSLDSRSDTEALVDDMKILQRNVEEVVDESQTFVIVDSEAETSPTMTMTETKATSVDVPLVGTVEEAPGEYGKRLHVIMEDSFESDHDNMIIWQGSTGAKLYNCRGWNRSDEEWERKLDTTLRKRDANLVRCAVDPKFRTRLCNHWDESLGTHCPMRKKKKCVFAHGPVELRVKEGKRHRWGKLVDAEGNNKNSNHSGGEDTYGTAKSIETERKQEGKWNTSSSSSTGKGPPHGTAKTKKSNAGKRHE